MSPHNHITTIHQRPHLTHLENPLSLPLPEAAEKRDRLLPTLTPRFLLCRRENAGMTTSQIPINIVCTVYCILQLVQCPEDFSDDETNIPVSLCHDGSKYTRNLQKLKTSSFYQHPPRGDAAAPTGFGLRPGQRWYRQKTGPGVY